MDYQRAGAYLVMIGAVLLMMAGSSGRIQLSNQSVSDTDSGTSSGASQATYSLDADGDVTTQRANIDLGGPVDVGDWITPKAFAPGAYQCRVTVESGTLSFGTEDTWQALTSNRSWGVTRNSVGTSSATLTVEIRLGTTVLASATVTLQATVT